MIECRVQFLCGQSDLIKKPLNQLRKPLLLQRNSKMGFLVLHPSIWQPMAELYRR
jgi:hypothetical protein